MVYTFASIPTPMAKALPVVPKSLSQYERGWLEAAFDGEGNIGLHREHIRHSAYKNHTRYRPYVVLSNTYCPFLEKAQLIIGSGYIWKSERRTGGRYARAKTCHKLILTEGTIRWLLPQLKLTVKKRQRELIIEVMKIKDARAVRGAFAAYANHEIRRFEAMREEMKRLNRRGIWA